MKWTQDDKQIVERLWREGASAAEIGRDVGRSRSAVLGVLGRMGLLRKDRPFRVAHAVKRGATPRITLVGPAWSVREIANCRHFGDAA
jgi:hypothetical protein